MLEKEIEKSLVKRVKGLGGICLKLVIFIRWEVCFCRTKGKRKKAKATSDEKN